MPVMNGAVPFLPIIFTLLSCCIVITVRKMPEQYPEANQENDDLLRVNECPYRSWCRLSP